MDMLGSMEGLLIENEKNLWFTGNDVAKTIKYSNLYRAL